MLTFDTPPKHDCSDSKCVRLVCPSTDVPFSFRLPLEPRGFERSFRWSDVKVVSYPNLVDPVDILWSVHTPPPPPLPTLLCSTSSYLVCQTLKPDLVINAGTAGGFKKHDTAIGDVFVSTGVKNHDRRYAQGYVSKFASAPAPEMRAFVGLVYDMLVNGHDSPRSIDL